MSRSAEPDRNDTVLRGIAALLTLATASIHLYLGGLLFTANGLGYAALAVGLVAPLSIARRFRFLVRAGLVGFTAATILGWLAFGARMPLAYADKGIELALIAVLIVDIRRADGGIRPLMLRLSALGAGFLRGQGARDAAPAGSK
jgi:hypothetical protein